MTETQGLQWTDAFLLGYEPMDDTHREFVDCVDKLLTCPDAEMAGLLQAFITHAEAHFGLENTWMEETGFPPQHLEGFEELIQDPYKLGDEVRGRKEEYAHLLERGVALDCRSPHRCGHCYLQPLCDTLEEVRETVEAAKFAVLRIDTQWEEQQTPVYGGDPASKKRAETQMALRLAATAGLASGAEAEAAAATLLAPKAAVPEDRPRLRLPLVNAGLPAFKPPKVRPLDALAREAGATTLWVVAPDLAAARAAAAGFPEIGALELELADVTGLSEGTGPGEQVVIDGKRLTRVMVREAAVAAALLAGPGDFEVALALSRGNEAWLQALTAAPARLVLWQPTHARLTSAA